MYVSRSGMTKHCVINHGCWYHTGRDEYVAILPEELAAVRAKYRAWQSHRPSGQSGNRSQSGSRRPALVGSASTRTGTSGPAAMSRNLRSSTSRPTELAPSTSRQPEPVPSTSRQPDPTPSTSRQPDRPYCSCGRGYGMLGNDYVQRSTFRIQVRDASPPTGTGIVQPAATFVVIRQRRRFLFGFYCA